MKHMANECDQVQVSLEEAPQDMTTLLKQHMTIPKSGGLTPRANTQHQVRAQMQTRKHPFHKLRDMFQFRIPMYQAAFGMAMACFVVLASTHIMSSNNISSQQPTATGVLDSTAVLGAIRQETLRTTASDSLGSNTFSSSVADTL